MSNATGDDQAINSVIEKEMSEQLVNHASAAVPWIDALSRRSLVILNRLMW